MTGGDPLDELGIIARSLRFRASATASLGRTLGAGNRLKWTWSGWVKRGARGAIVPFFAYSTTGIFDNFGFNAADQFYYASVDTSGTVTRANYTSPALFRDPAAWYHFVIAVDTAQAVAADRLKVYVNGGLLPLTANYAFTLNWNTYLNSALVHNFAFLYDGTNRYFDGEMAHVAFIDGQALDPTPFGQFHPATGQWRPKAKSQIKAVVGAGGVNSFFLPFDDPTNLTTLCADASAKGNNWTATNVSLTAGVTYDSLIDTPTNNFPVLNSVFANYGSVAGTISDGGLKFASSTTYHFTPCTIPLPEYGKWECEFIPQDTGGIIGVADLDNGSGSSQNIGAGLGWYGSILYTGNAAAVQSGLATMAANDKITVAVDMDARIAKWYQNGVLRITQALTAGKRYAFACGDYYAPGATSCFANFGQYPITNHVAGYLPLNTKNLRLPVVPEASSAFVAVTDTGANVQATLAAARAGWGNYIEIFKRRDAAEGWRWRFSDDSANYMDSSSTAAKAAFPALVAGGSYVGYALKVAGANGVATGRLVHTNGVADTVTDGLGNARKAIILKNEATGDWYFYHPELTAGKLLYLNLNNVETTDGTLFNVLSGSFQVAAALASGTYRWVVIAEASGFSKMTKRVGNGSADGPVDYADFLPAFSMAKCTNNANAMLLYDNARDLRNPESAYLQPAATTGDTIGSGTTDVHDFVACGVKGRSSNTGINTAGNSYISLLISAAPFRYANAR